MSQAFVHVPSMHTAVGDVSHSNFGQYSTGRVDVAAVGDLQKTLEDGLLGCRGQTEDAAAAQHRAASRG